MKRIFTYSFLAVVLFSCCALEAQAQIGSMSGSDAYLLYNEAVNEYNLRHLKAARTGFEKFLKEFPQHQIAPRVRIELARIYIDMHDYEKAIELLTAASEGPSENGEAYVALDMLADLLFDLQRFKNGIELLEKHLKSNQKNTELARKLAKFYMQVGRSDEAWLLLENLLERTAQREVFMDLLTIATKSGNVERLLSIIQQRNARYRAVDYLDFVSDCYIALNKLDAAAALLRDAPETSTNVGLLRKLAKLELDRNDPEASLRALKHLEDLLPNDWETVKAAGHCLFLLGKPSEALLEWRKYLRSRNTSLEAYQLFTDVLIEHKMYKEALEAFAEARRLFGNPTQFAEERAGVLEAMGRREEALDEYLAALAAGLFKIEIFDKLYKNQSAEFNLRDRLKQAMTISNAFSLKKALLELMLREEKESDISEIVALAANDLSFDDVLHSRIRQSLIVSPDDFLLKLCVALIKSDLRRELSLKLCNSALEYYADEPLEKLESIVAIASEVVAVDFISDAVLKASLIIRLGRTIAYRLCSPDIAVQFFEKVLSPPFSTVAPKTAFDAALMMMRYAASKGDMNSAESYLAAAASFAVSTPNAPQTQPAKTINVGGKILLTIDDDGFGSMADFTPEPADPLFDGMEWQARLLVESAWLKAQKSEYQAALDDLKKLTEEYPQSLWLNDALELALKLTMGSTGGLQNLNKLFEAERFAAVGNLASAAALLEKLSEQASGTSIALDAAAEALLYSETVAEPSELAMRIASFTAQNPAHPSVPDLMMLQWRLLKRIKVKDSSEIELLKSFVDRFPGDLRCRRVKIAIAKLLHSNE